ncbi:MAG: glucosyl-3-phosphoglycerate synthase [bacterium]
MSIDSRKRYQILIPLADPVGAEDLIQIGSSFVQKKKGKIVALGVVKIPKDRSLSEGASVAKEYRQRLQKLVDLGESENIEIKTMVRTSHQLWEGIVESVEEEECNLILLGWKGSTQTPNKIFGKTIDKIAKNPPCDIAVVKSKGLTGCKKILLPVRGGPNAQLGLNLALALAKKFKAKITAMYIFPKNISAQDRVKNEEEFLKFLQPALNSTKNLDTLIITSNSVTDAILKESKNHDLIIMGASASLSFTPFEEQEIPYLFGQIPETIAKKAKPTVAVVKRRKLPETQISWIKEKPLSVFVDKWFAENTFHQHEFEDINQLVKLKEKQGITISLGLPTLNEEKTIEKVIRRIKTNLMDEYPLLDEMIVIDSGSTDNTVEIASQFGIPIYSHQQILPEYGSFRGKGEALWKSLYVLKGDIIVWVDTDIRNIHPKFVYGLIGPLLKEKRIKYVKGFYRRPIQVGGKLHETGGGRVTELTARPLLNLFFPQLSGIIQPLSGEYAGRRELLEKVPFFTGYGVETGLLIDILRESGLMAIGQVDLEERIHRNQPLFALGLMSFGIIQVVIKRIEDHYGYELFEEMNRSMKLIHYEPEHYYLEIKGIEERERPPIITIPEYQRKQGNK